MKKILLACILASTQQLQAQTHHHPHSPILGTVDFRNSGSPAAQPSFQRGVALLHSFEYDDAAKAFREAEHADSTLVMAYYLESFTHSHILWGEEDLAAAQATLVRLGSTREERLKKARTPREREWADAIESYFSDGPVPQRVKTYATSMLQLATTDTTDLEAAAFAAHALIMESLTTRGSGSVLAPQARDLALRVFRANPHHPGAAHYMTHLADVDPHMAASQLEAARAYDKIAPDATHALHMPSHVYLPLGMWPELVKANERSWAASRAENDPSWHALEWLQYGYLQVGRMKDARALIDTAAKILRKATPGDDPDSRFALDQLRFAYSKETGDWSGPVADGEAILRLPTPTLRFWTMATASAYQAGVRALMTGKRDLGSRIGAALRARADTSTTPMQKAALQRMATQLDAIATWKNGDAPQAIALLQKLAPTEATSASTPPTSLQSNELLGDILLEQGRKAEAEQAYRAALAVRPNTRHAKAGIKSATQS